MFGRRVAVVALALVSLACAKEKAEDMGSASATQAGGAMDAVEYTLVYKNAWTAATHPIEYPEAGAISGPHYSGIVGATHNGSFSLFKQGAMPTPGLEMLSEMGKPSPLDEEI